MNLTQPFIPDDMKLGLLFFQQLKIPEAGLYIGIFRQYDPIRQYWLQHRHIRCLLNSQSLSGIGGIKPGNRAHHARLCLLRQFMLIPGIDADLIDFAFPDHILYL